MRQPQVKQTSFAAKAEGKQARAPFRAARAAHTHTGTQAHTHRQAHTHIALPVGALKTKAARGNQNKNTRATGKMHVTRTRRARFGCCRLDFGFVKSQTERKLTWRRI